jgi:hypothetical protein
MPVVVLAEPRRAGDRPAPQGEAMTRVIDTLPAELYVDFTRARRAGRCPAPAAAEGHPGPSIRRRRVPDRIDAVLDMYLETLRLQR